MSCAYLLVGGSGGPFKVGWVITRAGTHLVGCLGRSAQPGSPQPFRSNFGPIQEGHCATFSAVSDTRCCTYLIFTAFLTAEEIKNLSALSGVAYKKSGAILPPLAAPNPAPNGVTT